MVIFTHNIASIISHTCNGVVVEGARTQHQSSLNWNRSITQQRVNT
ncbi:hypothetical protein [Aetokthonos hydrillicola]|jgi:hypothetical protein